MDIRHLQYFEQVATAKSFTKAAELLHISQPTISKLIRNLEDEWGVTLFDRSGREIELTDAGRTVLGRVQLLLRSFDQLGEELDRLKELKSGVLRIGLPPMVGASFFPDILGEFHRAYPGIDIQLAENGAKQVEKEVATGRVEVGVALLPVDQEAFHYFPFRKEHLLLIVPKRHPLAGRASVRLDELKDEPFLLFREDFALHDRIPAACLQAGFQPRVVYESSQWDFISEMAAAGLGIGLLPETIARHLKTGPLAAIPVTDPQIPWHLAMIWRKEGYLSYAAREWIAFARRRLENRPV
ncbi:putative HTH-type transcriptional regulator YwbI [Paenibacillus sp. J31TS4]|uniref:LysR family transcriptional regulator n=1 Tax=Paenibacillus sp. J31TS4 TaxID=2807195 RepID=UPI001B1A80DE|nr:LysR family transcriptional regulator [Paenibacillus sp. J31TS4]GIP39161.1 putative HTH-type transcriptional regulator YwbI [Paenibacillus sp. J31TS4]